jgi:hypothetical protein
VVDGVGLKRQRIAHHDRACIGDEYVESAAGRDGCNWRVTIGAVGADRFGACLTRERLRCVLRTGIGEGDLAATARETADNRRANTPPTAENEDVLTVKSAITTSLNLHSEYYQ